MVAGHRTKPKHKQRWKQRQAKASRMHHAREFEKHGSRAEPKPPARRIACSNGLRFRSEKNTKSKKGITPGITSGITSGIIILRTKEQNIKPPTSDDDDDRNCSQQRSSSFLTQLGTVLLVFSWSTISSALSFSCFFSSALA